MGRYGGIDVGGTSIKYGIVLNGKVDSKESIYFAQDGRSLLPDLTKAIRELIDNNVNGIGIGFPGHTDASTQSFLGGPNLQEEISVSEIMKKEGFENYKIDNDGNVAALAEYELFYKEKVKNFIFLSFGTGIGGGVINDSKLIRGEGAAGELGHILISNDPSLEECSCGLTGCFESLASAKQWSIAVEDLQGTNLSKGSDLFNKNLALTQIQINKRDDFISHISRGLISLYEIFDNQVFVIGGSFTDDESDLVDLLNERIGKETKFQLEYRSFPEIHIAQLKSDAGIIGASFLVQ
ncbi:MAG: hypothetical protein CL515_02220 [Actinobacteria bacterium]|nr:hypothetical protein [Actinomycetota bacterium]